MENAIILVDSFIRVLFTPIKLIVDDELFVGEEKEAGEPSPCERCCDSCDNNEELTHDDIKVVMGRLGMGGRPGETVGDGGRSHGKRDEYRKLMEGVHELLEEKRASLEELEEAFYLFDRNEDGFISPTELWSVMRRLGLKEGTRLEDCERMISVFDEDGDGRINFSEFKKMMEGAI